MAKAISHTTWAFCLHFQLHSQCTLAHCYITQECHGISNKGSPFSFALFTSHVVRLQISSWRILHTLVKQVKPVRLNVWGTFWIGIKGPNTLKGVANAGLNGPERVSIFLCVASWLAASALPQNGTCILQKSLWSIGSVNNLHQLVQHHSNVWLHFRS